MSSEIFAVAARRRAELVRKVELLKGLGIGERVSRVWVPYEPKPKPLPSVAGVDGGSGRVDFQGFTLYGVTAVASVYMGLEGGRYSRALTIPVADVDILTPPQAFGRIDLYRETLEAKVGVAALLEGSGLVLMDGSIKSVLITPSPLNERALPTALKEALNEFGVGVFNDLGREVTLSLTDLGRLKGSPLSSREVLRGRVPLSEEVLNAVVALEYVEKLEVYRRLIVNASEYCVPVIFISKTGRSQVYFRSLSRELGIDVPSDINVFQYLTRGPGYSRPYLEERPLKVMPDILNLKSFYSRLRVMISYVRLGEGLPVLKVEVPYVKPLSLGEAEDVVRDLMDCLTPISTGGYPYPLLEAHELAHVRRHVMEGVARVLGLTPYLTGREVLREWAT